MQLLPQQPEHLTGEHQTAVVIGAGIGGITAAAHLARRGYKVTVYEKNARPGGRCDHFTQEGHQFDTGPTLFIMPHVYEKEFGALGGNVHDLLDLRRVDPTYHLVFDDGTQLALTSDLSKMFDQLERIEPGSFNGFMRYLEEGHQHYDVAIERLVDHDFRTAVDFFNPRNVPLLFEIHPLEQHYRRMSSYFQSPRLKAAFTFQDVYMGLSPFEAPATFSMMPYTELAHGVWYPMGGMHRVVDALVAIARDLGVEFVYETSVQQIDVNETHVNGIVLEDGSHVSADVVVANADLPYVYEKLLPDRREAEALQHHRYSCSVISFFWAVDKRYETLNPHTLFLVDDYEQNFEDIEHDRLSEHSSLYIHAPVGIDPSLAPEGQDSIIAIVPVGHLSEAEEQDWRGRRDHAREIVFNRLRDLGITDLPDHIKFEVNYTPLSWRKRYNLVKGATHGLSHTLTQLGYLRPHNRHAHYTNLYFVGASTHPGTGVPTALVSGRLVAERIFDEMGAPR